MALADDKRNSPSGSDPTKPARERGGWLAKIAPGVRKLVAKRETPDNLWVKCPDTGEMIYRPDLEAALWVTPAGRHMRIGPDLRFAYTFDGGRFEASAAAEDAGRSAAVHLRQALRGQPGGGAQGHRRAATPWPPPSARSAASPAVVLVQDFAFMGGSLGMAAGEAFIAAAEEAVKREAPLVVFTASGGARMQEGTLSLMQMARTTLAIQRAARGAPALRRGAHRPDHRRRHRLLRHAGRRAPGRARRADRLRRPRG